MRGVGILFCLMLVWMARAGETVVRGKVTYIASGVVYTSLGREGGVADSSVLFILAGADTTAWLKVFAVSSKSSGCRLVKSSRLVNIGDDVVGLVIRTEEKKAAIDSVADSLSTGVVSSLSALRSVPTKEETFVDVQGRISAQYYTSIYHTSAFDISQPGIVLNLRAVTRDVPLKLDVYANFRTLSLGGRGPFSKSAINQSRIYGLSLGYDDGQNVLTVGRIIPTFSPSIGYVDGGLVSKRFGNIVIGSVAGFQPDYSLRSLSSTYKKFAFFAQYLSPDRLSLSVSTAYARTYFHSALDREAASILVNTALTSDVYIYANSEIDLRKKSGSDFVLSPALTSLFVNVNYRITNSFSVGVGADAARPYYSFESVKLVPDSLLSNELRSGMSVSFNWFLARGFSLYNTYTPRNSNNAAFGREYSNYSSLSLTDIFSTGISIRSNFNLNANQYTNATGYGVSLQRTFEQLVDLTVRFQRYGYTVKQTDLKNKSTTMGADIMLFITHAVSFIATYDRLDGYGTISNSVFAEISVRF